MSPERLGKILNTYLARAGLHQKIREQKILDAWEGMVGEAIAEMTQPVRVRNRVLQVKVTNSVWMHELQFHKKLIIQKLNEYIGGPVLREVWFFIGEKEGKKNAPPEGGKRKREGQTRELTEEEKARIEREISQLRDPEMKEVFSSVFSRGLASEKANRKKS